MRWRRRQCSWRLMLPACRPALALDPHASGTCRHDKNAREKGRTCLIGQLCSSRFPQSGTTRQGRLQRCPKRRERPNQVVIVRVCLCVVSRLVTRNKAKMAAPCVRRKLASSDLTFSGRSLALTGFDRPRSCAASSPSTSRHFRESFARLGLRDSVRLSLPSLTLFRLP